MSSNRVKNKITDAILLALEKAADGYLALDYFYRNGTNVLYGPELPKTNLRSTIHRLSKKGYIRKFKSENRLVLELTESGRNWVLKHSFDESKWDGLWRIVIFDIPESHKRVRETLRRKLKDWGFAPWQKSVWATKKPVTRHIRELTKELEVGDWVLIFESANTGRE